MNRKKLLPTDLDETSEILRLGLTAGMAILILGALLWGLRGMRPAHADSDILYVDGAGGQDTDTCGTTGNPCRTISHTLNLRAGNSDTIRVAQGVYIENLSVSKTVALEGGYEATNWTRDVGQYETIIDGSNGQPVWGDWDGKRVLYAGGVYTMWYDNEKFIGVATSSDGIDWTEYTANPVLSPCPATQWGSPVVLFTSGSEGSVLDGFTVRNGTARDGGGIYVAETQATIQNCNVMSNTAYAYGGAGLLVERGEATITANTITSNAVKNGEGSGVLVDRSVVTLTNNVIASNQGDIEWNGDGVTVWGDTSDVTILNSTVVSNTGEGIEAGEGTVQIQNTIIAGNDGGIHNFEEGASVTSNHNALWNNGWNYSSGVPATDDIEANPLFVDAAGGDFHLQADSPCVNAGSATGAPAFDIEGTARDAAPDIGAYEWGKYRIFLSAAMRDVSTNPLVEWTEKVTVTVEMTPEGPKFSTHSFCARGTNGSEHWVTLGSCDTAMLSGRACPGLCSARVRPHLGGTIPLEIDGECMTFYAGPAFDPVTYELGGGAQVTLYTESATAEGDVIVLEFVGIRC